MNYCVTFHFINVIVIIERINCLAGAVVVIIITKINYFIVIIFIIFYLYSKKVFDSYSNY